MNGRAKIHSHGPIDNVSYSFIYFVEMFFYIWVEFQTSNAVAFKSQGIKELVGSGERASFDLTHRSIINQSDECSPYLVLV